MVIATSTGDWLFRVLGPILGALLLWLGRKMVRSVDEINENVRSIPGIRTDVQALQSTVEEMNTRMDDSRSSLTGKIEAVAEQLNDRQLLSTHVGTIAHLMEQRLSAGAPHRANDPEHSDFRPERTP